LAESQEVSKSSSQNAVSITDDRLPNYRDISDHWLISNPEGYAKWFENRMRSSGTQVVLNKAQVDNVPLFNMKTPLQRVIQILKRHRDQMFENNDESKPISIIISTLAARSYEGELDLKAALEGILNRMDRYISSRTPRVANPVNPGEDFADRWAMPQYANLELEQNFRNWLKQARADFQILFTHRDRDFIGSQLKIKMGITLGAVTFDEILLSVPVIPYSPKIHLIESDSPKPWRSNID
ncbi:MAG: hypothetical protein JKY31_13525, partial [Rhodobacteraceae bacterium]|nr:hypothetical protein [Paracoccaceae bacterium]